jgi:hypothetical protein
MSDPSHPVEHSAPLFDGKVAGEFFQLLGVDSSTVHYRGIHWNKDLQPKSARGVHVPPSGEPQQKRLEHLQQGGYRLYWLPNGGPKDEHVTSCRFLFIEWDDGTFQEQWQRLTDLGLPAPTAMLHSGGKSLHCYWRLSDPIEVPLWCNLIARLIAYCKSDPSCCNPSRLMRLPGSAYIHKKGDTDAAGNDIAGTWTQRATLNPEGGASYPVALFDANLPPVLAAEPAAPPSPPATLPAANLAPLPGQRRTASDPRSFAELERLTAAYPQIMADNDQYHEAVQFIFGLCMAAEEAGHSRSEAVAMASRYHPGAADTFEDALSAKIAKSKGGSFFKMCKAKGVDITRHDITRSKQQPTPGWDEPPSEEWPDSPAAGEAPPAAGDGVANGHTGLRHLKALARQLLLEKTPVHERMALIRAAAAKQGLTLRDGEIIAITAQARRDLQGKAGAATPDDEFDIPEDDWVWDQVIATGVANLIVALQKVGKTALVAAMVSTWYHNAGEFLGLKFNGPCPPVIIAGTDQLIADWKKVLAPVGLMEKAPSGKWKFCGPIKKVWHRSQPVFLDMTGIEDIAQACAQFPGALLICDTYAALIAPLGLDEAKPEAAEPLYNLMEMIEPFGITVIMIHHASKSRAHERASNASRNSNAVPAAVSQCISLHWASDSKSDQRINLTTEGRNSRPIDLVIEQVERSQWVLHGDGAELKEQQRLEEAEDGLNDRQGAALDHVRDLWSQGIEATAPLMQDWQPLEFDNVRKARKTLQQLHTKGLLEKRTDSDPSAAGTVIRYRPAGADVRDVLTRGDVQKGGPQCPQGPQPPKASEPWVVGPQSPRPSAGDSEDPGDPGFEYPRVRGPQPVGSGADAFDELDDPHWPKRREAA